MQGIVQREARRNALLVSAGFALLASSAQAQEPTKRYEGGVSKTGTAYNAPVYVPEYKSAYSTPVVSPKPVTKPPKPPEKKELKKIEPKPAPPPPKPVAKPTPMLNANASMTQQKPPPPPPPPKKAEVKLLPKGVLPGEFIGQWQVFGNRQNIIALPQFAKGVGSIFSPTTSNLWTISGSPGNYTLTTDSGVTTHLDVGNCSAQRAWIRYQHSINKTVAVETICLNLGPGGASFQGGEKIEIAKPGEGRVRCTVNYGLSGRRR